MIASITKPGLRATMARGVVGAVVAAALPLAAMAGGTPDTTSDLMAMDHIQHVVGEISSPLVKKVHDVNLKYRDINQALHKEKGWVVGTPCVSGPETGAMGIHVVNPNRLADGIIDARFPEALIYEPQPDGRWFIVGVEFIQDAADWAYRHPDGPPPSLDGNLMNLVGAPNRYGLKAFYELHVWAFEENPMGAFADWNTNVTCENQPVR